jgi:hypothetical protein
MIVVVNSGDGGSNGGKKTRCVEMLGLSGGRGEGGGVFLGVLDVLHNHFNLAPKTFTHVKKTYEKE